VDQAAVAAEVKPIFAPVKLGGAKTPRAPAEPDHATAAIGVDASSSTAVTAAAPPAASTTTNKHHALLGVLDPFGWRYSKNQKKSLLLQRTHQLFESGNNFGDMQASTLQSPLCAAVEHVHLQYVSHC